jgi:ubiquinone/menaquinone biosynthesis C-methylase UbiE
LTFWRALPNVFPMQMDSTRLQFNDNFFDAVFCVSSIEHIGSENGNHEGAVRAMREMIRVTKPGGLVAFSTELHPDERHDAWWFSREGLDRFIANLTGNATKLNVTVADGAAEGFPLYPVAFAMRKL